MKQTRRSVLKAGAGALAAGGFAGCLDAVSGGPPAGEGTQASFYLLYDFARHVGGDAMEVDSVVPFGQHGHGWEPSGQEQRDIQGSELFVYMAEGFQPWADDMVGNIEDDGAETHVVAAREGVDLLEPNASHDHDHDADHEEEEHDHEGDDHDHEEGGGHDYDGRVDPHFWLDPVRTRTAVENVRDGMIEVDGENADAYEANADDYLASIDDLHAEFESTLEDADKDVVLVAGHDVLQYLGDRYGFEVRALAGISPDEEPSNAAVREAREIVAEHDLEYVLAPALESDRAARQLVDETDASEVLEISAISGVTDEWLEEDWGYLEIMANVNLPSLTKALQAE